MERNTKHGRTDKQNQSRQTAGQPRAGKKKAKNKFTIHMQKKLVVLVVLVLLAFVGLSIRLYMLVRDNGDSYERQILSQQEYSSTSIPYKRGNIVDCNGTVLATSEKVYNLIIDSREILSKEEYLEPTIAALATCFEIDTAALREYILTHENSQYYVLLRKLSYDQKQVFEDLRSDTQNNPNIKGVWFETEYQRTYPYTTLACDVLGFTGTGNEGMYGLEQYYNEDLNGSDGREYGYLNEDSTLERTTIPAEDGHTLVTTIDTNIQSIVERNLYEFNEKYKNAYRDGLGAYNTACIIMNPNTADVLAMASYPNFDCNNPYELSYAYTEEEIAAMTDEEYTTALNALWQNFCITSTYEPGSTAKPFTIATGLETGALSGNESYFCGGYLQVDIYQIHCHNRLGHGAVNVRQAMESSCNVALMHMGAAIGKTDFLKYQQAFNFGLKTNIDLAGEARTDALVYNQKTMNETELATSSFGQGYNVTMIQMVTAYCSLINGGYYYEPHMVDRILNAEGAVVENIEPRLLKQTVSATTSQMILDYCNAVVLDGTGRTARPAGYTMGGKTGTAETVPRDQGNYVVSFIGYVPAEKPEVVIYVVVDRANQKEQDNSRLATELVRNIMTEVLPYMGIPMTEELTEAEQQEIADRQQGSVDWNNGEQNGENAGQDETDNSGADAELGTESDNTGNGDSDDSNDEEMLVDSNGDGVPDMSGVLNIEIDPETGYAIDPATGEFLDPETGRPIDPNSSFMSPAE